MSLALRRTGRPALPHEIQDEVELYARESGRTATLYFAPTQFAGGRCLSASWIARFSLRCDDKRMLLWKEGKAFWKVW